MRWWNLGVEILDVMHEILTNTGLSCQSFDINTTYESSDHHAGIKVFLGGVKEYSDWTPFKGKSQPGYIIRDSANSSD